MQTGCVRLTRLRRTERVEESNDEVDENG